jgi:prophage DNA circulation protein
MKIMKVVGSWTELFSPNDPELVEKTLARIAEQDTWNDVFSTKLIELLDNVDQVKSEVRERMRTVESVTQTASTSLERAETAHKQASQGVLEGKRLLDQSTSQLGRAQNCTEEATRQLHAAGGQVAASNWTLKNASELQTAAAKEHINAVRLFRAANRRSVVAIAASWTATTWMAWFAFRPTVPLWAAWAATVFLIVAAALFDRVVKHEG